jgi:hypothetical protein
MYVEPSTSRRDGPIRTYVTEDTMRANAVRVGCIPRILNTTNRPLTLLDNSVTEFTSRHCSETVTLAILIARRLMARFQGFYTWLRCREGSAALLYCILVQSFGSTPKEGISSLDCYTASKEELSNPIFRFHRFPCHYTKWLSSSRLTLFISWKMLFPATKRIRF